MAEKEYIERNKAYKLAKKVCKAVDSNPRVLLPHIILDLIDELPAADVRPVVLCKDCQNSYEWANVEGDTYRYCGYLRNRWNHNTDRIVDDEDYCKWGRKREES